MEHVTLCRPGTVDRGAGEYATRKNKSIADPRRLLTSLFETVVAATDPARIIPSRVRVVIGDQF